MGNYTYAQYNEVGGLSDYAANSIRLTVTQIPNFVQFIVAAPLLGTAMTKKQKLCVVYENQRSTKAPISNMLKIGSTALSKPEDFSSANLMGALDRPDFSSVNGKEERPNPTDDPPAQAFAQGYKWDTNKWMEFAWEYSSGWNDEWTAAITEKTTVRRRRYERMLIEAPIATVIENQKLFKGSGGLKWTSRALDSKDPPSWMKDNSEPCEPKQDVMPKPGYRWTGEWQIRPIGGREMDKDGSGNLDYDEFHTAMNRLGLGLCPHQLVQLVKVLDADGDGFGNPSDTIVQCSQPADYVLDNTDCNDSDQTVHDECGGSGTGR